MTDERSTSVERGVLLLGRATVVLVALVAFDPARAGDGSPAVHKPKIALDALGVKGVSAALAEVVQERICASVAEASGAEVVCPADVAAAAMVVRTEMTFGKCQSDDCLRKLDAIREAERHVAGTLERDDKGIVLSLRIVGPDGPGPQVVEKLPENLDALLGRVSSVVKRLFKR